MHQINPRSVCLLEAFKSIKYLEKIILLTKHCWWDHHNLQLSFKLTGSFATVQQKRKYLFQQDFLYRKTGSILTFTTNLYSAKFILPKLYGTFKNKNNSFIFSSVIFSLGSMCLSSMTNHIGKHFNHNFYTSVRFEIFFGCRFNSAVRNEGCPISNVST